MRRQKPKLGTERNYANRGLSDESIVSVKKLRSSSQESQDSDFATGTVSDLRLRRMESEPWDLLHK
mgnify:CR=1 FL=1